jgi:hypothetical protein
MSLMGPLAKVAIGVMAAKEVGSLMNKSGGTTQGVGGLLGGAQGAGGGGIETLMSGVLGGGGQGGGLGGLMEQRGGAQGAGGGGMPGGRLGGRAGAGGIQGLRGSLMGGAQPAVPAPASAARGDSFEEVLNQSFAPMGEPAIAPGAEQDAAAGLMPRPITQAAKSDGASTRPGKRRFSTISATCRATKWKS